MATRKSTRAPARKSRRPIPESRGDTLFLMIAGACAVAEVIEATFPHGDARFVVLHRHIVMPLKEAIRTLGGAKHAEARLRAINAALGPS